MKINKYYPFAFIYFFLNSVALPLGVLYTTLLTPVFYIWLLIKGRKHILIYFLLISAVFGIAHLLNGVLLIDYVKSYILFLSTYIFCYTFYVFCIKKAYLLEDIYNRLAKANFVLTLAAIFSLFTAFSYLFWTTSLVSASLADFPRLTMFTYEPSYYSTLLAPLFLFFFLKFFLRANTTHFLKVFILGLPLLLSFSLGVLSAIILSITLFFLINYWSILTKTRFFKWFTRILFLLVFTGIVLLLFYPDNPLFIRIGDIMAGTDTSAKGRTFEAFELAYIIAGLKSLWWGVGLGQVKTVGYETIINYYNYPRELFPVVRIPNAFAETLAVFGIVGISLRLLIQIYLFFKTNVLNNYYQTLLFFYVFIYQFTGSYLTNIAEYIIWIMAFTNCFPQFNKDYLNRFTTSKFN
ncbi:hypothetical protein GXP67_20420 [Rhodocytophaga rosea]|uniref:O-antigen ligase family protein n=1 Tax=Rhodocytophaga rosea TaxID=2704465 RepID=A0A6C0GMJ2_9BACT|nr:hypothetical protein [Rhodocytophaga rosea]QHT68843.1 hypothetical protein GXP67_20420 [Rhodocytophaga rosea]